MLTINQFWLFELCIYGKKCHLKIATAIAVSCSKFLKIASQINSLLGLMDNKQSGWQQNRIYWDVLQLFHKLHFPCKRRSILYQPQSDNLKKREHYSLAALKASKCKCVVFFFSFSFWELKNLGKCSVCQNCLLLYQRCHFIEKNAF